ncbi:MAG TPA: sugar kinase [Polyangiaceae bacterium]|nr:sugar kinase [Polyangiaceae bacterium]
MIITQTPYRVSFAGGGTDLPAFYEREDGAVLSVGVNHHMYVTVSPRFEKTTRIAYTKVEICETIDAIEHTLARETLRITELGPHVEITTVGDVPAGTGMGSSSSLTVGLLQALYAYRGQVTSARKLAEESCRIEIDILKKPIGKQDQYAAAFGGLNYITFHSNGSVSVEPVPCRPAVLQEVERRTILLYTGTRRSADAILKAQSEGTKDRFPILREMRDLAATMRDTLTGAGNVDDFAAQLHHGWELKRSLGFGITSSAVDDWYQAARKAGAQGGKLLGAGGGGFLLLMAPPERHEAIREACGRPREIPFEIDRRGSRVIFISDRYAF